MFFDTAAVAASAAAAAATAYDIGLILLLPRCPSTTVLRGRYGAPFCDSLVAPWTSVPCADTPRCADTPPRHRHTLASDCAANWNPPTADTTECDRRRSRAWNLENFASIFRLKSAAKWTNSVAYLQSTDSQPLGPFSFVCFQNIYFTAEMIA